MSRENAAVFILMINDAVKILSACYKHSRSVRDTPRIDSSGGNLCQLMLLLVTTGKEKHQATIDQVTDAGALAIVPAVLSIGLA